MGGRFAYPSVRRAIVRRTTSQLSIVALDGFEVLLEKALLRRLFPRDCVVVVDREPPCPYCTVCHVLNCRRLCRYLYRIIKRNTQEPHNAMTSVFAVSYVQESRRSTKNGKKGRGG